MKYKVRLITEIDKIRNRVLYSKYIYQPNEVLDIIDEITEAMGNENENDR